MWQQAHDTQSRPPCSLSPFGSRRTSYAGHFTVCHTNWQCPMRVPFRILVLPSQSPRPCVISSLMPTTSTSLKRVALPRIRTKKKTPQSTRTGSDSTISMSQCMKQRCRYERSSHRAEAARHLPNLLRWQTATTARVLVRLVSRVPCPMAGRRDSADRGVLRVLLSTPRQVGTSVTGLLVSMMRNIVHDGGRVTWTSLLEVAFYLNLETRESRRRL